MYSNLPVSDHFHPDTFWNFLDFFTEAPTIDYLIHRNPILHPFSINRKLAGSVQVDSTHVLTFSLPAGVRQPSHLQFVEARFRRHLDNQEQQTRLELLQTLQANNPVNLANNTFHTRLARLSSLFQNNLPDTEFTTYHHQLLLHCSIADITTLAPVGQYGLSYVGFSQLLQLTVANPGFLSGYYPIVWDHYAASDINDFQFYLDCLAQFNAGISSGLAPLLLVLFDATALSTPLTAVAAPGAAPANAPAWPFIARILSFMNVHDRKQFCLNQPILWYAGGAARAWSTAYVPEYNFANHVLEVTALNWSPVPIQCVAAEYDFDYITAVLGFIQNCIVRRLCDFLSINVLQEMQLVQGTFRYLAFNQVNIPTLGALTITNFALYSIPAFELLEYIFDKPLIMQPYDITKFRPVIGAAQLEVMRPEKDNERLKYMPSWSAATANNSPFNAMLMPQFDTRFSQGHGYILFASTLYIAGANIRFFPVGSHLSPPINTGSQSPELRNESYYKVNVNNWGAQPSVTYLLDLPQRVSADIGVYEDAGVSFLV